MKTKYIKSKVASFPQAKWIEMNLWAFRPFARCSRCKTKGEVRTRSTVFNTLVIDMPYCPACGAFMSNGHDEV